MTKDRGYAFAGVEKILHKTFLPRLFFEKYKYLPPIVGTLSKIPVKNYYLGLKDPVISTNKKCSSSLLPSSKLIGAVTGERVFSTSDHLLELREENRDGKKSHDDSNEAKLKELVKDLKAKYRRLVLHTKNTCS